METVSRYQRKACCSQLISLPLARCTSFFQVVMMPSSRVLILSLTVALGLSSTPADGQRAARKRAEVALTDSMAVSTEWLAAHLEDPKVVVVEVTMNDSTRTERIPGSRAIAYRRLTVSRDGISTELPSVDSLKTLFEGLGISDNMRVVVYAHEAPMATRMLMTLDYLGHSKVSYLDGGFAKWAAERRAAGESDPSVAKGTFTPRPRAGMVVTADWITANIGKPGLALIDTRTDGEYNGSGNRSGMPSAGHLAGARQLEWQSLFQTENPLLLKDRAELRGMFADRAKEGDVVVTYCWVGYRASATYFAARLLGLDARFYDGSYQDWQVRKLPTTAGATP